MTGKLFEKDSPKAVKDKGLLNASQFRFHA
jgi:hypothetical protein